MANAITVSNSNFMGVPASTNTTVSSADLSIPGTSAHQVLLIGEFSADCKGFTNGSIVGDIQVDGNTVHGIQVNNLNGTIGTIIAVSGITYVAPGTHRFDLRAFTQSMNLSVHHRTLSVIDLD